MTRDSFINRDKNHGSVSHRRAPKQEKELSLRMKGKQVPGSGCSYQKGDVKKAFGVIRIEAKTTKNKSFSVTRDMVRKIEDAALTNGEVPVIVVEFIDEQGKPEMEVAVVPTYILPDIGEHNAS